MKDGCETILGEATDDEMYVLKSNYPSVAELNYKHKYSLLCKQLSDEGTRDSLKIDLLVSAFLWMMERVDISMEDEVSPRA